MVMNVTSMLSSGYLRPTLRPDAPQGAVLTETIDRSARTQQRQDQTLARQERQVLAEEQGLRVSAGPSAEVTTVYHYTLGSDGKRYITGASVMMKGDRPRSKPVNFSVVSARMIETIGYYTGGV